MGTAVTARRTAAEGTAGAVATAHPLATGAGLTALADGGSAVDAAVCAQAVLCVTSPHACGVGGDVLALVAEPGGRVRAVNGTGRSAAGADGDLHTQGGASVTVPGIVDGWARLHERWGRLPWRRVLAPALALAADGVPVDDDLARAAEVHRPRLERGGGAGWSLLARPARWRQPELAELLERLATHGAPAFYRGEVAAVVAAAVRADGGWLGEEDLAAHRTRVADPVSVPWQGGTVHVQPPSSQGVLLALALDAVERRLPADAAALLAGPAREHVLVEVTQAAFAHRDGCADPAAVLAADVTVDAARASRRGGPRAYLHTAGVAAVDAAGTVVSSLVSVFDDFGAGTFVPRFGFTLNNRAGGFTGGANRPRPSALPVHTLAPALQVGPGGVTGLATPGADGQVQTLLQVLARRRYDGVPLAEAVAAPRWRSEDGALLVEEDHPAAADLHVRGHDVVPLRPGDDRFGAVVAVSATPAAGTSAVADWRRGTTAAAL
ncbi:gamma-glutamyltransferase [Geodermatophilus sp. SYSU D00710]